MIIRRLVQQIRKSGKEACLAAFKSDICDIAEKIAKKGLGVERTITKESTESEVKKETPKPAELIDSIYAI